ncbi:hypothetical protein AAZX31_01G080400 [Glycine max]
MSLRDFFDAYDYIFCNLHVEIPFDDFTMSVLYLLNVVPSQLYPNGWAAIQAFRALCQFFRLEPKIEMFLYLFRTRPSNKARWFSLTRHNERSFFRPFTTSYRKN